MHHHKPSVSNLTPLSQLKVTFRQIPAFRQTPNTSLQHKPLLHYHNAFPESYTTSTIQSHLKSVNVVSPQWVYSMYPFSHFHSTSHEVLSIASGSALCCFGGEENEGRYEAVLERGDVVVVPAGVGHRLLEEREKPFQMVGSYTVGKNWDMCYGDGRAGEEGADERVKSQEWFTRDPIYGEEGPVLDVGKEGKSEL